MLPAIAGDVGIATLDPHPRRTIRASILARAMEKIRDDEGEGKSP